MNESAVCQPILVADNNWLRGQRSRFDALRYRCFDIRFHQTIAEIPENRFANILIGIVVIVVEQFVDWFAISVRSNVVDGCFVDSGTCNILGRIRCVLCHGRRQTIAQTDDANAILSARRQDVQFGRMVEIIQMQRQQLNLREREKYKIVFHAMKLISWVMARNATKNNFNCFVHLRRRCRRPSPDRIFQSR